MTRPYNSTAQMASRTAAAPAAAPGGSSSSLGVSSEIFNGIKVDTDALRAFATAMKQHAEELQSAIQSYSTTAMRTFPEGIKQNTLDKNPPPVIAELMQQYQLQGPEALSHIESIAQMLIGDADNLLNYANQTEQLTDESTQQLRNVSM